MRRAAGCLMAISACLPAYAAEPVDETYVRSLAAPGKTVLVMEYYDGQGKVSQRKGYASASGFGAISATDFRVDANLTVHLYGIEPCQGDMVNLKEDFAGSCHDYALQGLATLLQSPRVIYCRAFVSETGAQIQDATCYGYYNYPGSLYTIDMFEEQLVSLGSHRVAKRPDGTPARADLKEAEAIGRRGYGMWADPRIAGQ
jgi:hypothetical protein